MKGMIFGTILAMLAVPLLFWNEGRAVKTATSLDEGRGAAVTTSSDKVDAAKEGKLVHTTGRAKTADTVADPVFGVSANALALKRKVEMYQWKQITESKGRGSDSATYRYIKEWSEKPVDSSRFKVPDEHRNPTGAPYKSEKWIAGNVTLGAYTLNSSQVNKISGDDPVKAVVPSSGPATTPALREHDGALYVGKNPDDPQIGDLRITFTRVPESDVSIVARQVGNSFAPYRAKAGVTVDMQSKGTLTADEMFTGAEDANTALMWGLRFFGFILMVIGIRLLFNPLTTMTGGIPIFGHIVGAGTFVIALLLATMLTLTIIGLAWLFYRPLLGIALLGAGCAALYGIWHLMGKARSKQTAPAADSA